jgi:hypothetical protein
MRSKRQSITFFNKYINQINNSGIYRKLNFFLEATVEREDTATGKSAIAMLREATARASPKRDPLQKMTLNPSLPFPQIKSF